MITKFVECMPVSVYLSISLLSGYENMEVENCRVTFVNLEELRMMNQECRLKTKYSVYIQKCFGPLKRTE